MSSSSTKYWLLKAEPDSRVVKGKDVKFSIDDFEQVGTSAWEGVRNYEARNLMKEMKEGDKALFYHSNTKNPGIAAFAKVSKEAYPDYTAWDASHPYFDPKSKSEDPKWFMVELTFTSRTKHFVPLSLLRTIAGVTLPDIPEDISYLGEAGVKAIKAMDLVTRGRLSVQRVQEEAWEAIEQLAEKGGWKETDTKLKKSRAPPKAGTEVSKPKVKASAKKSTKSKADAKETEDASVVDERENDSGGKDDGEQPIETKTSKRKRMETSEETPGLRRSTRAKK